MTVTQHPISPSPTGGIIVRQRGTPEKLFFYIASSFVEQRRHNMHQCYIDGAGFTVSVNSKAKTG
jgi:hypothetical protein